MRQFCLLVLILSSLGADVFSQGDRRLIPVDDQRALREVSASALTAEVSRVRAQILAPAGWRLDPDLTAFYNPAGMTQGDIDTYEAAQRAAFFARSSRQKDTLATCALVVRAKGLAAWTALTIPQKVTATLAECDAWVNIRDFIETNVP